MAPEPNHYELLGLTKDATQDEVRRAYHEAARRLHPDVNVSSGATEMFLCIQEAYEVLSDPIKRNSYDAHLPESGGSSATITVKTLHSRTALLRIDEPQLVYMLLQMGIPPGYQTCLESRLSPPLNICLVLDRSTSMQGERMDTVKAAAIELTRQLKPEDVLSIIVFSDRAEVLLAAGRRLEQSEIETRIQMIKTGGGTELLRGLEAGFFEARRNLSKSRINHLILLTDGHTYGDETACQRIADQASHHGIGITGLGIGHEWNDTFLDSLATLTGGSSMYISHPQEIKQFLKGKLNRLGRVYAEQVILEVETGPGISLVDTFRMQPEATPLRTGSPVKLGNVPYEGILEILFEFMVAPVSSRAEQTAVMKGNLSWVLPSQPDHPFKKNIALTLPISNEATGDFPPPEIVDSLSRLTLYRMQDRARQDVAAGQIIEASRRLQHMATHLFSHGERELAQTVLKEAEHLNQTQMFSLEGEKQIKYGTRALLLPARAGEDGL